MKSSDSGKISGCAMGLLAFGAAAILAASGEAGRAQGIPAAVGGTGNETVAVTSSVSRANRYFGAHTVLKVRRDRDGGRALPDDPIAAIQSTTALPPYI